MHLHFERTVNAKSDCSILSLTWMGKVPDELPEDEGWKLNRTNYYQEGWLATGNIRGIVGVTFTTSHCKKNVEFPLRTNYNLRGHRSEVILVKWNEPYQKLASCDSSGIIFVWIKYEGRWSIELINDRNTPVTHFSWSHDGRMALICYQDGFVLVGSVAGQRYWSSMLNLEATITSGIWTPDDQQVYFGTTAGQIIVMDVHGAMVSQVQLSSEVGISSMAWSCEKFKMEEGDDNNPGVANAAERKFVLAVSLQNGLIYLLKSFDDVSPVQVDTGLQGNLCMEWSNSRELLAVAGIVMENKKNRPQVDFLNMLKFYNEKGELIYAIVVPFTQAPISALTWGHNDKRLFLATGTQIHIAWVSRKIATLQLLCRLKIHGCLHGDGQIVSLPLPPRIRGLIGNLFAQTMRCCVPEPSALRQFVSRPPNGSIRLHCTMIRHDEDNNLSSGTCYTLYLEYLGGLVPLLKGKRTSKIRPEFVIFDPQVDVFNIPIQCELKGCTSPNRSNSNVNIDTDSSDSDREEGCTGSPRMQKRRKKRNKSNTKMTYPDKQSSSGDGADPEDLAYVDTLPEHVRLVEVTSNIWGTKFKIHGLVNSVPANLGQVTYKTSLLHLQPRQMTLVMTELRDDFLAGPDPTFNPNLFSEDEEDTLLEEKTRLRKVSLDNSPPIAPMSPRGNRLNRSKHPLKGSYLNRESTCLVPALAKAESYEDDFSYVELSEVMNYCESIRPHALSYSPLNAQSRATTNSQSTSFVGHRNNTTNSGSQKHAISPLCCEGSVPALQSPKNAVAPSDIIFDRPPAQTLISYSTSDYSNVGNNIQQIKSNIMCEHNRNGIALNLNSNTDQQMSLLENLKLANGTSSDVITANVRNNFVDSTKRLDKNVVKLSHNSNQIDLSTKELIFIDDEHSSEAMPGTSAEVKMEKLLIADSMVRSCSVGYLDLVDAQIVPNDIALLMLRKDAPKRLVLVDKKYKHKKTTKKNLQERDKNLFKSPKLKSCGKSKSLDSSDIFPSCESPNVKTKVKEDVIPEIIVEKISKCNPSQNLTPDENVTINNNNNKKERHGFFGTKSPLIRRKKSELENNSLNDKTIKSRSRSKQKNYKTNVDNVQNSSTSLSNTRSGLSLHTHALATLEHLLTRLKEDDSKRTPPQSPRMPRSSPSSPAPSKKGKRAQSASPIRKNLLSSPLLGRNRKNKNQESSEDEVTASGDEICNGTNYTDLETFQKAQLRQKLKRGKIEPNGSSCNSNPIPQRREFVMHNKAPMWNENSQVYQLDFGGRVTQESAKNFQIEFRGKQVMQFGRIDGNAYTLDFQYPFSALQAFAVALANVTQRLK